MQSQRPVVVLWLKSTLDNWAISNIKIQLCCRCTIKWCWTKKKTLTEDLVREWEKQTDHHWRTFQKEMTFTLIHPLTPLRLVALLPSNNDITHARRKCEWSLGPCWCSRRGVNKGRSDFHQAAVERIWGMKTKGVFWASAVPVGGL